MTPPFAGLPLLRALLAAVLVGAAAVLLAACSSVASAPGPVEATEQKKIVLSESDYDLVFITGSNLPVRVPKNPITRPLLTSSPVTIMSPEDFEALVQRAQTAGRP